MSEPIFKREFDVQRFPFMLNGNRNNWSFSFRSRPIIVAPKHHCGIMRELKFVLDPFVASKAKNLEGRLYSYSLAVTALLNANVTVDSWPFPTACATYLGISMQDCERVAEDGYVVYGPRTVVQQFSKPSPEEIMMKCKEATEATQKAICVQPLELFMPSDVRYKLIVDVPKSSVEDAEGLGSYCWSGTMTSVIELTTPAPTS